MNSSDGRLSFYFGNVPSDTQLWVNSATLSGAVIPSPVLRRDFECGVVLLNGDTLPHTVAAGPGLKRLTGGQAPLHQYFIDDNSSAFQPANGSWEWGDYNSGYKGGGSEEVRPPDGFYHHWERGAHAVRSSNGNCNAASP